MDYYTTATLTARLRAYLTTWRRAGQVARIRARRSWQDRVTAGDRTA